METNQNDGVEWKLTTKGSVTVNTQVQTSRCDYQNKSWIGKTGRNRRKPELRPETNTCGWKGDGGWCGWIRVMAECALQKK